jgi:hypothetical protein
MPKAYTIRGVPVSDHTFQLNKQYALPAELEATGQPATKRTAVKLWKSEREFQAAVFKVAEWEALQRPEFSQLFHIANENAHRNPGVKGGVPDLFLPVARGKNHGLFIELKVGSGKPSRAQLDTISRLRANGYSVHVIWDSVDEVIQCIADYLVSC